MIERDAQPIANRNPYKRVDLGAKRLRQRIITREQVEDNVFPRPSEAHYDYDEFYGIWTLRD